MQSDPQKQPHKSDPESLANKHLKGYKPLKLFGGNKLPDDWTIEKAVEQMDKVSKHTESIEEALRSLGLK